MTSYKIGTMRRGRPAAGLLVVIAMGVAVAAQTGANPQEGSEACARCHAEIYKSYSKTAMANASGAARDGLVKGEFTHKPSGMHYRVDEQNGRVWMSYERPNEKAFGGERELEYSIGAGVKERSYLFSVDGFWFETPIRWYAQGAGWNVARAFAEAQESSMNQPAVVACLNCHGSGVQAPVAGTESKYAGRPFLQGGITCQRCHGGGDGRVNPAKLPAERRDSICMQCHFEGVVAERQPGKRIEQFQPGERLSDYLHYFLLADNDPQKPEELSQFEALSLSACKRKSGDKMWCGSCHDPHGEPAAAEKTAYYRGKCVACHGEEFAASHHPEKPGCTACHMPAVAGKDVHAQWTDHRIEQYPNAEPLPRLALRGTPGAPLVAYPERDAALATTRDFALGWEALAARGVDRAPQRAEKYLQKALKEGPEDASLWTAWGVLEQRRGHPQEAKEAYERALKLDPLENDAAADLGVLEAKDGNLQRAVELWQRAFARAPQRSAIGVNLAMAFCVAGQKDDARKYVRRVLEFNPDYGKAKSLLGHLGRDAVVCTP